MGIKVIEPCELDVVFLSFDEPKADEFYQTLLAQTDGRAKHVSGVVGFDAAHKAAARAASTEYFVLVDGDSLVYDAFWSLRMRVPLPHQDAGAFSFCARNVVNDLCYGYGGLKIWNRDFVFSMRTHENSDSTNTAFEFCWLPDYRHFASIWNDTHINQSPQQAFRAGYREVFKLMCPECQPSKFEDLSFYVQRKVVQWCTVGADAPNGMFVLAGANAAFTHLNSSNSDAVGPSINSYDYLDALFTEASSLIRVGDATSVLSSFQILSSEQSLQVKKYVRHQRWERPPLSALTPCEYSTE